MGRDPKTKQNDTAPRVADFIEDELVPPKYRVRAPELVWNSREVTWHGQSIDELAPALAEAMRVGDSDLANGIAIELLASGFVSQVWDAILSTVMLQGLGLRTPHLWSMFLGEYRALTNIRNRLNRLARPWDVANHQEYRNHLAQCITVICLAIKRGLANPLPTDALHCAELYITAPDIDSIIDGADAGDSALGAGAGNRYLYADEVDVGVDVDSSRNADKGCRSDRVPDSHARSVAQEYILLTRTPESPAVGIQELHFNLSRFFQSVNRLGGSLLDPEPYTHADVDSPLWETFFWINEIVTMREPELHLRRDFQYYMPRMSPSQAGWVTSPSNILWNYLFIRTPNKFWKHLAALMEVYTFCWKRKEDLTCSAILYNLLLLLMREQSTAAAQNFEGASGASGPSTGPEDDGSQHRLHDAPAVMRTVLNINLAYLRLKEGGA